MIVALKIILAFVLYKRLFICPTFFTGSGRVILVLLCLALFLKVFWFSLLKPLKLRLPVTGQQQLESDYIGYRYATGYIFFPYSKDISATFPWQHALTICVRCWQTYHILSNDNILGYIQDTQTLEKRQLRILDTSKDTQKQ